jgi:hypothetical protein
MVYNLYMTVAHGEDAEGATAGAPALAPAE